MRTVILVMSGILLVPAFLWGQACEICNVDHRCDSIEDTNAIVGNTDCQPAAWWNPFSTCREVGQECFAPDLVLKNSTFLVDPLAEIVASNQAPRFSPTSLRQPMPCRPTPVSLPFSGSFALR